MPEEVVLHENQIDLTLFVACYNEEENIIGTLDTLLSALAEFDFSWEILVIDDASTDRSVELVQRYIEEHPGVPIRLKVNESNKGLAQNYIEGAFLGRGRYYRLICGDNVAPKEALVPVFKRIGEADMIIPYDLEFKGRSSFRKMLSRAYTVLVNLITGNDLLYYNGLAVHLRYNVLRWHTDYHGFGFQADLITRLLAQGFSYVEVPIAGHERTAGGSKALTLKNLLSIAHTFSDLAVRRVAKVMYRRR
jgi:glycosyltransferase involved in cell wall biosynthesis